MSEQIDHIQKNELSPGFANEYHVLEQQQKFLREDCYNKISITKDNADNASL
jgi:hypothetical protein